MSLLIAVVKTIAPVVSLIVWSLWMGRGQLVWLGPDSSAPPAIEDGWLSLHFQILVRAQICAITCSFLLWKTGLRIFALLLTLVSFFALWKVFLGPAVFKMFPALGGLSFSEAMTDWWRLNTATPWTFVKEVPFAFFLLLSVFFWPLYAVCARTDKSVSSTSAPN